MLVEADDGEPFAKVQVWLKDAQDRIGNAEKALRFGGNGWEYWRGGRGWTELAGSHLNLALGAVFFGQG